VGGLILFILNKINSFIWYTNRD